MEIETKIIIIHKAILRDMILKMKEKNNSNIIQNSHIKDCLGRLYHYPRACINLPRACRDIVIDWMMELEYIERINKAEYKVLI